MCRCQYSSISSLGGETVFIFNLLTDDQIIQALESVDQEVRLYLPGIRCVSGSAVSLAQAGATVVDMQVAGRWKSSQMLAHYAKAELAERGGIARFKDGKAIDSLYQLKFYTTH